MSTKFYNVFLSIQLWDKIQLNEIESKDKGEEAKSKSYD